MGILNIKTEYIYCKLNNSIKKKIRNLSVWIFYVINGERVIEFSEH